LLGLVFNNNSINPLFGSEMLHIHFLFPRYIRMNLISTVLISNHIQKNEIYGTATIPSANAAALDADGILLPSSDADANAAAAEEPEYIMVMAI